MATSGNVGKSSVASMASVVNTTNNTGSVASRVATGTLRRLPRKRLSRIIGHLADARPAWSAVLPRVIAAYRRIYEVDMSEVEHPIGGWTSFDEFFTRRLRPGARPIEGGARAVSSPADGRVLDHGPIDVEAMLTIKGKRYRLDELLGEGAEIRRWAGGQFAVVYLSPRDYHRVHAAVRGRVTAVRHLGGTLLPVNTFGVRHFPKLFAQNERVAVYQETAEHGPVATVLVGAIGVGRISLCFDGSIRTNSGRSPGLVRYPTSAAPLLERGEELGAFHLGSTVILFFAPQDSEALRFRAQPGDSIRMGQVLAER